MVLPRVTHAVRPPWGLDPSVDELYSRLDDYYYFG